MNKDAIKERLTNLRLFLTLTLSIDTACIAWFVTNFNKAIKILVYYNLFLIILLTGLLIFFSSDLIRNTNKLEEL